MKDKQIHTEGYWYSTQEPQYPKPIAVDEPFEDKQAIVDAMKKLEKDIYLHKKGNIVYFKGFSTCRCCKEINGTVEYTYKNWKWPEGLIHYVEVHNIRPSDEFIENVLKHFIK
jgi:hypothetical protein